MTLSRMPKDRSADPVSSVASGRRGSGRNRSACVDPDRAGGPSPNLPFVGTRSRPLLTLGSGRPNAIPELTVLTTFRSLRHPVGVGINDRT